MFNFFRNSDKKYLYSSYDKMADGFMRMQNFCYKLESNISKAQRTELFAKLEKLNNDLDDLRAYLVSLDQESKK